jgi:sugar phosphate isomerase/epimerase
LPNFFRRDKATTLDAPLIANEITGLETFMAHRRIHYRTLSIGVKLWHAAVLTVPALLLPSCTTPPPIHWQHSASILRDGLALQLWSFHADAKLNLPGTLSRIKAMGFNRIETIEVPGYSTRQLRFAMDSAGLRAISAHFDYERVRDDLPNVIADAKTLGVRQFGISAIKIFGRQGYHELTIADANEAGAVLAKACGAARSANIRVFLHIHGNELAPLDGINALDRMITKAGGCFDIEADIYWIKSSGTDPVAFITRYGSKVSSVHLKDWKPPMATSLSFPALGMGNLDIPAVLRAARSAGTQDFIIEDESGDAKTLVPRSLAYLATLPK